MKEKGKIVVCWRFKKVWKDVCLKEEKEVSCGWSNNFGILWGLRKLILKN